MSDECTDLLRKEIEPVVNEMISKSDFTEVLEKYSMSGSEAVEITLSFSKKERLFLTAVCTDVFVTCPRGRHPRGNCSHRINCVTKEVLE